MDDAFRDQRLPKGRLSHNPPLPWIGARFKFEVREKDGNKVWRKPSKNRFFQRATVFYWARPMRRITRLMPT